MGISGLLPFLKKSSVNSNIRQFKGKTVAIDAYCWLHKGAFSCAEKLVIGEKTDAYVVYCMKYVNMLLSYDIKPILVFDGQPLPSKLVTEIKRRENRERYKIQAREYLRQGNKPKARECFQKCVDITSVMALNLIKACRAKNVDCIVAPYEADSQLAFLSITGIAYCIITEDSDLLAFGCPRVFFKMDQNGTGVLIEKDNLYLSLGGRAEYFNSEKFRRMCILAGCDYLPSLPGIGLGKAFKFFSRSTNDDINLTLCRLPSCLNMPQLEVNTEYRNDFIKAEHTFLYQLVYDPQQRKLVPLTPYPPGLDPNSLPFAGEYLEDHIAFDLAIGNLDVDTLQRLDNYNPDNDKQKQTFLAKHTSIWSTAFSQAKQKETPHLFSDTTSVMNKQTKTKVKFTLSSETATLGDQVTISDSDLTSQYAIESRTLPESPTSPVLTPHRKRKRFNENSSPGSSQDRWTVQSTSLSANRISESSPAVLDPFCDEVLMKSNNLDNTPMASLPNPFIKHSKESKDSSPPTSPSSSNSSKLLRSYSQLKTKDANGQEIITSAYFQTKEVSQDDKATKSVLTLKSEHTIIQNSPATTKQFKPVLSSKEVPTTFQQSGHLCTPTPTAGPNRCKVSGISSRKKLSKTAGVAFSNNSMRQLSLRDMFSENASKNVRD